MLLTYPKKPDNTLINSGVFLLKKKWRKKKKNIISMIVEEKCTEETIQLKMKFSRKFQWKTEKKKNFRLLWSLSKFLDNSQFFEN